MDAIYILMPTSQSVDFIIRDLQEGRYRAACLLFIDGMPPPSAYLMMFCYLQWISTSGSFATTCRRSGPIWEVFQLYGGSVLELLG